MTIQTGMKMCVFGGRREEERDTQTSEKEDTAGSQQQLMLPAGKARTHTGSQTCTYAHKHTLVTLVFMTLHNLLQYTLALFLFLTTHIYVHRHTPVDLRPECAECSPAG